MRSRRATSFLTALLTMGVLVASCAANGSIVGGQKFGVEVGMPSDEASAILTRRGLQRRAIPRDWSTMCGGRGRQLGENLDYYSRGVNQSMVCLFTDSDRVVAIAWETPFM